ncbi:hypothetical protein ACLKA7_009178 [Drosophila subpalustris]
MKEHLTINIVAIVPMILGGLIFLMALLGCCGALRGKPCQLRTFSVIMLCLFIGTVTMVIFVWTDRGKIIHYIEVFVKDTWSAHKRHKPSSEIFHKLETQFKCCGENGVTSYTQASENIPPSCCGFKPGESCPQSKAYSSGCLAVITDLWNSHAKVIKFGALAASGVTLLASTFASYLAHKMVRSVQYEYEYD